ncbi:hypothetical protein [Candidatus Nanohalobium constans]|uniref:Chromosome segregation ATPase n=1 Tax=Candidatus Nanohalobium constans TaxID=2565781 RepID=A0A5Q0UFV3_9ARCH|nr:hypothetical protein [Candidatus Nanohalobium constans]QGA80080.1 chromosome segregation ATPase [Candidatus Nanohalobium constans]
MPDQDQLYVKLEGHEDLRQELHSINHIVKNVEEASQVLEEIRSVKQKTIQNIQENILELNQRIENIHSEMPNVEDQELSADISPSQNSSDGNSETGEIDQSVNQLHDQLQTLKDELQELD